MDAKRKNILRITRVRSSQEENVKRISKEKESLTERGKYETFVSNNHPNKSSPPPDNLTRPLIFEQNR